MKDFQRRVDEKWTKVIGKLNLNGVEYCVMEDGWLNTNIPFPLVDEAGNKYRILSSRIVDDWSNEKEVKKMYLLKLNREIEYGKNLKIYRRQV